MVFLHRRNAGKGDRLVFFAVVGLERHGLIRKLRINGSTLTPSRFGFHEIDQSSRYYDSFLLTLPPGDRLQVFAGEADHTSSATFAIRYRLNDQDGVLTGRLTDQDTILLEVQSGPLLGAMSSGKK